jgi:hypothetical protein
MFSVDELKKLINNECIGSFYPYIEGNEVENYIKLIVADLNRSAQVMAEPDYSMYGSGYASYVDIFCYKRDGSSKVQKGGVSWIDGITVYICRLAPIACFGATQVTRHPSGGSHEFLRPERLEVFPKGDWEGFANEIKTRLAKYNISIIDKNYATEPIPFETKIATILSDSQYKIFDAFFYWED